MSSKLGSCEDRGSLTVQELTQNIPTRDVLSQARVMCYVRAVATRAQECLRGIRNQHFMAGSKPGRAFIRDNSKHVHVGKTRKNTLTPGAWEEGTMFGSLGEQGVVPVSVPLRRKPCLANKAATLYSLVAASHWESIEKRHLCSDKGFRWTLALIIFL